MSYEWNCPWCLKFNVTYFDIETSLHLLCECGYDKFLLSRKDIDKFKAIQEKIMKGLKP